VNDKQEFPGWPEPPESAAEQAGDAELQGDDEVVIEEIDELARITAERDDYLDQLQRSRAEFANFRRRKEQEQQALGNVIRGSVLREFLPIVDDFERGLGAIPETERESGWVAGITMIQNKLNGILERAGVTAVGEVNQPFDPSIHEAVATEPGTKGDTVVEVYQRGYKIGDQLIRPAMVKTGDASAATSGEGATFDA